MNGADTLVKTLLACNVDTCFTNPGTSEIHFLAALDANPKMRCILGLQEGVVTGAADGYARMAGKPACTLLHCGPGLANGLSNLHNARKAQSPVVNIVGDHATYHLQYDAPLTSDVEGTARPYSDWVKTVQSINDIAFDGASAVAAAQTYPGNIATLILPADIAWDKAQKIVGPIKPQNPTAPSEKVILEAHSAIQSGQPTLIFCTGAALMDANLKKLNRIATATGCQLLAQTSNKRIQRGFGRFDIERLAYPIEEAREQLRNFKHIILLGTKQPVSFFAYPNKESRLSPKTSNVITLATPKEDVEVAIDMLLDVLGNPKNFSEVVQKCSIAKPSGVLNENNIGAAIARHIPENGIIADESITTGRNFFATTYGSAPHDWLHVTGGAIGCGMPQATGAAIACPERKVINLQADGSAMYTLQSLWTQAREGLDVITVLFSNRAYKILQKEMEALEVANPGQVGADMVTLDRPDINWVAIAEGHGVSGTKVENAESLDAALEGAVAGDGPFLIEVMI